MKKSFITMIVMATVILVGAGCNQTQQSTTNIPKTDSQEITNNQTQKPQIENTKDTEPSTKVQDSTNSIAISKTPTPTITDCKYDEICFKKNMANCSEATHIYSILTFKYTAKIENKGNKCNIHVVASGFGEDKNSPTAALEGTYYNCEFSKEAIKTNPDLYYKKTFEEASAENCSGTYVDLVK